MKKTVFALIITIGLKLALSAAVETSYVDFEKFTDFELSGGTSKEGAKNVFDRELKEDRRIAKYVGEGRILELVFTDIDMAGDISPFGHNRSDVRVVKSIYPPHLEFTYKFRDFSGGEIASGDVRITDINFQFDLGRSLSAETFYYELKLLEGWLGGTLRELE